jgi:hypothetical protein
LSCPVVQDLQSRSSLILIFIKIYCIPYSVLIYFSIGWRSNSMY